MLTNPLFQAVGHGTPTQHNITTQLKNASVGDTIVIRYHDGGLLDVAESNIRLANRKNIQIQLNGTFLSAGTMWLGAKNVCVTQQSEFLTHYVSNLFNGERLASPTITMTEYQPPLLANETRKAYHAHLPSNPFFGPITGRQLINAGQIQECI